MYYIGIDIGGTKTAFGLFDDKRQLIDKDKILTDKTLCATDLCNAMISVIDGLLGRHGLSRKDVGGIGAGCPSTVNAKTGVVNATNNIPKLSDFNLRDYLAGYLGCRALVDNDANLAALAEYRRGAGRGHENMMYYTASTGMGGGFILDGRLYRGANCFAGEIGHSLITPGKGLMCGCGNRGCFESYAGGSHIDDNVRLRVERGEKTLMTELSQGGYINGEILYKAYFAGDAMAAELLDQIGSYAGLLMFNIYQIINVDCYVIGGGLANFGEELFGRIRASFNSYKRACSDPVYFLPAELKQDFGIIGAVEALFDE